MMSPINSYNIIWPPAASVRSPHRNENLGLTDRFASYGEVSRSTRHNSKTYGLLNSRDCFISSIFPSVTP